MNESITQHPFENILHRHRWFEANCNGCFKSPECYMRTEILRSEALGGYVTYNTAMRIGYYEKKGDIWRCREYTADDGRER